MTHITRCLFVLGLSSMLNAQSKKYSGTEWASYGGTPANLKYSVLDQINRSNLNQLRLAWRWKSIDEATKLEVKIRPWLFEVTPLMIAGRFYVSTGLGQIAAIDASSGETLWTHDPKSYSSRKAPVYGFTHRGVAYWPGSTDFAPRILIGTVDGRLLALDAKSGKPAEGFGSNGSVDLGIDWSSGIDRTRYTVTSPPVLSVM